MERGSMGFRMVRENELFDLMREGVVLIFRKGKHDRAKGRVVHVGKHPWRGQVRFCFEAICEGFQDHQPNETINVKPDDLLVAQAE